MSKLTLAIQTFLFTAMAFVALASSQVLASGSEFDPALTGRVNINGSIISSACDIDTGDDYQEITMPSETRAHIKKSGEGEPKYFSILLKNCIVNSLSELPAWQYINIIFDGDEDGGMFRVNGNARGIALELLDHNDETIFPGKTTTWQNESNVDNRLNYKIKLKRNMQDLVAGDYNATIRYRVEYF